MTGRVVRGLAVGVVMLAGGLLAPGAVTAAEAASCGGLLQPKCPTTTTDTSGGGTTTSTSSQPCGGLLQPKCPTSGTGTTSGGTTVSSQPCGGFLQPKCPPPPPPPACKNGLDDDKDGAADLYDPGCKDWADTYEGDDLAPDVNGIQAPVADVNPYSTSKLLGSHSYLGLWDSGVTPAEEVALLRKMGAEAQRIPITWYAFQPKAGTFNVDPRYDALYAELLRAGIRPIMTIGSAPVWASDYANCGLLDFSCRSIASSQPPALVPADVTAYGQFVRRIAQRYPQAIIEPWNEPNIVYSWRARTFPDSARMARMQCTAYDVTRSLPAPPVVLSAGFGVVHLNNGEHYPFLDFVHQVNTAMGRRCWDAFNVHAYPGSVIDGEGSMLADMFRLVRNARLRAKDTTPIWVTETGASTSGGQGGDHGHTERTPEEQARMMRAIVNELLTSPDVAAVFVHSLRDRPDPAEGSNPSIEQYGFGMLQDGAGPLPPPKPAFCHFVSVVGNTYPGC